MEVAAGDSNMDNSGQEGSVLQAGELGQESSEGTELNSADMENNTLQGSEDNENSGFPSIMCAETISEDAFEEDKLEDGLNGDGVEEEEATMSKEQEPVNESTDTGVKDTEGSPVKKESLFCDYDGDNEPNEDPNIDNADSDQEMDPDIAAAMEASLLEAEQMDEAADANENGDTKDEDGAPISKEPFFMFRNETEVDSAEDNDIDSAHNGAGSSVTDEGMSAGAEDDEYTLDGDAVAGEMDLGGTEMEAGYNPMMVEFDGNPLDDDPGDYDPLVEDHAGIAVDEDTNGFLDKVNSGFMTQIHNFPGSPSGSGRPRGPGSRGPYRKTRERMGDVDIDYDPLGGPAPAKKMRVRGAKGQLSCNICHFPFTLIGDLKLHKYTDHENQPKPNYLDLAEAALTRLPNKNGGVSSQKLLKEILNDPMTSDTKQKASIILNKALKFGVEKGRLRLGKAGKHVQRYRLSMKGARKQIIMQYNRNKKLVDFDEEAIRNPPKKVKPIAPKGAGSAKRASELEKLLPAHISITPVPGSSKARGRPPKAGHVTQPDPKVFGRGKRTPKNEGLITLDDDSDSDIEVISEKITKKPKKKITIVRVNSQQAKGRVAPHLVAASRKLPSNLVKVGGSSKSGVQVPRGVNVIPKKPVVVNDEEEDEDDFTCPICFKSFWFKGQLLECLKNNHNVEDPEKYLREKKKK